MARRAVLTLLAWLCLSWAGAAQALTFPALTGRVVDEAGLLSAPDRAALTASLAGLEATTTDQLVVVTLKSLQGTSIADYGYQLGRNWGIGQKDKDSGVLLIVAPNERQVRIEVGYGLEGTLTDAATKIIIETSILPDFKTGDFSGGIKNGTAQIIQILEGEAAAAPQGAVPDISAVMGGPSSNGPTWPIIVFGVAGVGLLIFCAIHGGGACRALMQIVFVMLLAGRGGSSGDTSSPFSGRGGSFGGGGSSGSW